MKKKALLHFSGNSITEYKNSDSPSHILTTKNRFPVFLDDFGFLAVSSEFKVSFPHIKFIKSERVNWLDVVSTPRSQIRRFNSDTL